MSPLLCAVITFALYYLTVGTLIWFVLWGRAAINGEFEGGSRLLSVAISLWIIVAWWIVLAQLARQQARRRWAWGPFP